MRWSLLCVVLLCGCLTPPAPSPGPNPEPGGSDQWSRAAKAAVADYSTKMCENFAQAAADAASGDQLGDVQDKLGEANEQARLSAFKPLSDKMDKTLSGADAEEAAAVFKSISKGFARGN